MTLAAGPLAPILRPRNFLRARADRARLGTGFAVVVVTAASAVAIDVVAAAISADGGGAAVVVAVALPLFYLGFWLLSAVAVDAGAHAMGCPHRRRAYLATSGMVFPVLVSYPLLTLAQTVAAHLGAGSLAAALGWLALPLLAWFVWLGVLVAAAVYEVELFSAAALALLPYAATTAALILFVIVISALHVAGLT